MRNLVNPQQTRLFDPFDSVLTPKARQRLLDSWPGVFRHVWLKLMPDSACSRCDFYEQCPVEKCKGQYRLEHTGKQRRLAARRREENTEVFRERYTIRCGIEGTHSGLKRAMKLGRLRVRGRPAVFHAIYLKVAGWNMRRAMVCAALRKIVYERAAGAVLYGLITVLRSLLTSQSVRIGLKSQITAYLWRYGERQPLPIAA